MIREYLDPVKLGIIECLFEKIETGASIKEIQASLPRNTKYPEKHLADLMEAKIVVCDTGSEAMGKTNGEKIYFGNRKSRIFTHLFNIDIMLGDIEHARKKKLRAAMLAPKKV